jgi:hypothetical protein
MWKITLSLELRIGSAQVATVPFHTPRANGTASMMARRCSSVARFVQAQFVRLTHGIAPPADSSLRKRNRHPFIKHRRFKHESSLE